MEPELGLDHTLKTDTPFLIEPQNALVTESYELRLHTADWRQEGEGIYQSPLSLIEACVTPSQPITTSYLREKQGSGRAVGRIIFVPPNERVRCQFTRGRRQTLSCLFDVDKLGILSGTDWKWGDPDPAKASDVCNPYISSAIQRLMEEVRTPTFGGRLNVDCAILFLVSELQRHFGRAPDRAAEDQSRLDTKQMATIRSCIEDTIGAAPSLQTLAGLVGTSAQSLSLKFRRTTQQTLRSYISQAKLARAKQYLADETLMLKQISYLSGFAGPAAFASAFRKQVGLTPSEYRQRIVRS